MISAHPHIAFGHPRFGLLVAATLLLTAACGGNKHLYDRDRALEDQPMGSEARPEVLEGDLLVGVRALSDGKIESAHTALTRHVADHADSPLGHYHLGLVAMEREDWNEARVRFEQALKLAPELYGAASNLGVVFMRTGEDAAALRYLRRAQAMAPVDPRVVCNLGAALLRRGLWTEAIQTYAEAYKLAPGHATVIYDYALALTWRQEWQRALTLVEEALQYRAGFALARALRVVCLQGMGKLDAALAYARLSLEEVEPVAELHIAHGRVLLARGQVSQGVAALQEAVELDPGSPLALMSLAEALDVSGRREDAVFLYRRYLEQHDRSFEDSRRVRDRLKQLKGQGIGKGDR